MNYPLQQEVFVCLDCETTGLDPQVDNVVEVAVAKFTLEKILYMKETLINPLTAIPETSTEIHHITDEMVKGKPTIASQLPLFLEIVGKHPVVGHGIGFDLAILDSEAKRCNIPCTLLQNTQIDTLRLARLYGESPSNSLETLRKHFNIPEEGAHRAMSDVLVNIEVFKHLIPTFKSLRQILKRLQSPILLARMPLGKHKGRVFADIPTEYLKWAVRQDFDMDLLFSIKQELKRRKTGKQFTQASSPFANL